MSAPGGSGPSLRVRIFGAMALVVLAGAGTLMIVSLIVAPGVFYRHLQQAGVAQDPTVTTHVADGFALATVVSTVVGVVIAGAVAAAMAVLVSRRIATPVTTTADAAGRLAAGDYTAHIDDLSLVSRAQERAFLVHADTIDLVALTRAVSEAARARFTTTGVDLSITPAEPIYVRADRDRIGEVIGQLLDNALHHTHPGDTVTIAVTHREDNAVLTVTDTGEGFHPEEADAIFDRFYRATSASGSAGSGIGLTIAQALINAHGGTITARSPGLGKGSTFTITLPPISG